MNHVSLVILTWNCLPYTQACLQSIRANTQGVPYEVIVVDNGSTDGTPDYLKGQPNLKRILNADNQGYPRGNNQGLQVATGAYLLLLNNDVIVTPDWLKHLLAHFERRPALGILGPRTNQISGEQKLPLHYDAWDISTINTLSEQRYQEHAGKLSLVNRLAGFCMMFKRQVMNQIGVLDESFGTGNFEDDDYCRRAQMAGFELGMAEDVFVHHFGSVTFLENRVDYQQQMALNRQIYVNKWGKDASLEPLYPQVQRLIPANFQRVLHIGCGAGSFGQALQARRQPHQVTGVETDPRLADKAREHLDAVFTGKLTQVTLPIDTAPFDVLVFNDVLDRAWDPVQLLQHWLPWLRPDGIVVAAIPNFRHFSVLKKLTEGHFCYQSEGFPEHGQMRWLTFRSISHIFERANLHIELWRSMLVSPQKPDEIERWQQFEDQLALQGLLLNELISDMLVYRFIVVAGFKSRHSLWQQRYLIDRWQVYWQPDTKEGAGVGIADWISSVYRLDCNITVHTGFPSDYRWDTGTLVHIARLNEIAPSLSLEAKERLADVDEIWVDSEPTRQHLLQQGYADEMVYTLPLLQNMQRQAWLEQVQHRLTMCCKKMGILRSDIAE